MEKPMLNLHIVCIDAQNDFTDPNGSLFVPGGDENVKRTARMIERLTPKITDIHATMDSHRKVDISHPLWWVDTHGKPPAPFTIIAPSDVRDGRWRTRQPSAGARSLRYLEALEASGRYPHCIWPEHCLIGDEGHNLNPVLSAAVHGWEEKRYAGADIITKGSNAWTEHFSAVRAEVPDAEDPSTQVNRQFVQMLEEADIVAWTGEALSHCLANTFRDAAAEFSDPQLVQKMVLLTDATSSVPGFEHFGDTFISEMKAKGMRTSTTTDFLA